MTHFSQSHQSKEDSFDILYITLRSTNKDSDKNVPINHRQGSERELWEELITKPKVKKVLYAWQVRLGINHEEVKQNVDDVEQTDDIELVIVNQITPFRIILQPADKIQLSHIESKGNVESDDKIQLSHTESKGDMKSKFKPSSCQYFALLWIPCNGRKGLNKKEYHNFILAMNEEKYFCNKLNKQCVYISASTGAFDLDSLRSDCHTHASCEVHKSHELIIDIVVHEFDRKAMMEVYKHFFHDILRCGQSQNDMKQALDLLTENAQDSLNENAQDSPSTSSKSRNSRTYTITRQATKHYSRLEQSQTRELPNKHIIHNKIRKITFDETKEATSVQDTHTFAFAWFKIHKKEQADHKGAKQQQEEENGASSSDLDVGQKSEADATGSSDDCYQDHVYGIYAALNVFDTLHHQLCDRKDPRKGVMNVELMGYDECYDNLSLGVDTYHGGSWKDGKYMMAFLIFIQCLFLPLFIILPPKDIMRCCCKEYKPTPKHRPQSISSDPWKDLDIIEQIPYDISAVWRRVIKKKLVGFLLSVLLITVVSIGPMLYEHGKVSFFDCYGPAIFYGLWIVTIICWSCSFRGLIAAKEHMLLYYKMIAQRPGKTKKAATDFDLLTGLSTPQSLTVFSYAVLRGFLESKTPTQNLLSERSLKCCRRNTDKYSDRDWSDERNTRIKQWILVFAAIGIYFCVNSLEDFQTKHHPFYVDKDEIDHHVLTQIYVIISNITSCILLFTFIILWETMFSRIKLQLKNVKYLTNLLIRNTYSEYITFDYTDNIVSWIKLLDYVKRKGMTVFASLETPVFSLFCMCILSWAGAIYCIVKGTGLQLWTDQSLFSNSALATWFYLAIFAFIQIARLLFYGYKYNRESEKQENAIRTQCNTIAHANLLQYLKHDELSLERERAMQSSKALLISLKDHREIVPTVFGIKFDKLASKVVISAVVSAIPTALGYIFGRIQHAN